MGEIAPGVLALIINLVECYELNGLTAEVIYKLEPNSETFYDPTQDTTYRFNDDDMNKQGDDWWGCVIPSYNHFIFLRSKNLLPIGKKDDEYERITEESDVTEGWM